MVYYISATVAFWMVCGLLSMAARKDRSWIESPVFVPASLVAIFLGFAVVIGGSAVAAGSQPALGAAYAVGAAIPGIVLLVPWLMHGLGRATSAAQRAALGIDSMKITRTYDAAEKLMKERKYGEAERAFLKEGEADADEPEPLRRAGDAALAAGRAGDAARHLLRALERRMPDEDRAALGFHVAEIQERDLGNPDEARRTLVRLKELLAGTRFAGFADERLERLDRPPVSS